MLLKAATMSSAWLVWSTELTNKQVGRKAEAQESVKFFFVVSQNKKKNYLKKLLSFVTKGNNPIIRALLIVFAT